MAKQVKKIVKPKVKKATKPKLEVNLGGAPAFYKTQQELKNKVDAYFLSIDGEFQNITHTDDEGNEFTERICIREPEAATITGLALFLGFESRQSVYDYEKNGKFSYTIKNARLKVENAYEKALLSKNATGAIFALKNFGWSDKQEIDHTSKGESLNPTPIQFT